MSVIHEGSTTAGTVNPIKRPQQGRQTSCNTGPAFPPPRGGQCCPAAAGPVCLPLLSFQVFRACTTPQKPLRPQQCTQPASVLTALSEAACLMRPPSSAGCVGPWRPARVLPLHPVTATPPVTGSKVLLVPVPAPVKPNREQRATPLRSPKLLPTSPKDSSKMFIGSLLPDPRHGLRRFLKRTEDRQETPPVHCAFLPPHCSS